MKDFIQAIILRNQNQMSFHFKNLKYSYYASVVTDTDLSVFPGVKLINGSHQIPWHLIKSVNEFMSQNNNDAEWHGWNVATGAPLRAVTQEHVEASISQNARLKASTRLYEHQMEGLRFALARKGSMLNHAPGAGKTLTSIYWSILINTDCNLFVTKAPLRIQWVEAFRKFTDYEAFPVLPSSYSNKKRRFKSYDDYILFCQRNNQPKFIILGYEALADNIEFIESINPNSVIFDESQKAKSKSRNDVIPMNKSDKDYKEKVREIKSKGGFLTTKDGNEIAIVPKENISSLCSKIARMCDRRLLITGTPDDNLPRDWWAQLDLVEPTAFGTFTQFAVRYCNGGVGRFTHMTSDGISNIEEFNTRKKYLVHTVSSQESHKNVPKLRFNTFYINEDEQSSLTLKEKKLLESGTIEDKFALSSKIKQKYTIDRIVDCLNDGDKVFVFTARRNDCESLCTELRKKAKHHNIDYCHGDTSKNEIESIKNKYINSPNACCLISTLDLMGTGVDGLQITNSVFYIMLPYKPGLLEQSIKRFNRLGQTVSCIINFMIAEGTIDERVVDILFDKNDKKKEITDSEALTEAIESLIGSDVEGIVESIIEKITIKNDKVREI